MDREQSEENIYVYWDKSDKSETAPFKARQGTHAVGGSHLETLAAVYCQEFEADPGFLQEVPLELKHNPQVRKLTPEDYDMFNKYLLHGRLFLEYLEEEGTAHDLFLLQDFFDHLKAAIN